MKKFVRWVSLALCCSFLILFAGCTPEAKEIKFEETSVSLSWQEARELSYTVTPANAKVEVSVVVSDETVVKYEDGTLTALTAGTATVQLVSPKDGSVYTECAVTVAPSEGYTAYATSDYKMLYPSSWGKTSSGDMVMWIDLATDSNISIVQEPRNESYWALSIESYKQQIEEAYKMILAALGESVTFHTATLEPVEYLGQSRLEITLDYTMIGLRIYQHQIILHAGDSTYTLTMTFVEDNTLAADADVIAAGFVGLR